MTLLQAQLEQLHRKEIIEGLNGYLKQNKINWLTRLMVKRIIRRLEKEISQLEEGKSFGIVYE